MSYHNRIIYLLVRGKLVISLKLLKDIFIMNEPRTLGTSVKSGQSFILGLSYSGCYLNSSRS